MEKCFIEGKALTPGVDCWVVDSGSGNHLISKADCSPTELAKAIKQERGLYLSTVNGTTRAEYKVPIWNQALEQNVWCWLMIASPKVISMHRLIKEEKAKVHWESDEVCMVSLRNKRHFLPVVSGVPLLKN